MTPKHVYDNSWTMS